MQSICLFLLVVACGECDLNLTAFGTKARPPPLAAECRANNLQPKRKGLSILFATVDGTKQGVCRAECIEAMADDCATAAEGREIFCYFLLDGFMPFFFVGWLSVATVRQ